MTSTRLILLLTLVTTGCQWGNHRRDSAKIVEPALPTTIGLQDLVEHLNRQNEGLQSWRCMNTQVHVSTPSLPLPQKLSGSIACAAPSQFRLLSDNTFGHADFGSNENICWAYVKPGEPVVMTWKHEDSHLLQHFPGGLPRLEPDWLMTILGVQPLDADRYDLQHAPAGSREVWLVAIEDAPDGSSLRRVIKVDTVLGVAREHALYDSNGQALLRAQLTNHRSCGKYRLPHTVKIHFPQCETELTLNFKGIETDCQIADSLWHPPHDIQVVDLGNLMRTRMQAEPEFQRLPKEDKIAMVLPKTSGNPPRSNLDGFPVPDQAKIGRHSEIPVTHSRSTDDARFFGDLPQAGPHKDEPDWDEESEMLPDEPTVSPDEFGDKPLDVEPLAPEFDVVAPRQQKKSRGSWWPFGK